MSKSRFILFLFLLLSLTKVDAQVNLQTGSAVFSLPMFNWQDNKSRLTSVVALSYNSGNGLKVNDVASNVGQGWNLITGGVISRIQSGEPDDQYPHGSSSETDITRYPAGILFAPISPTNGCPDALTKYPIFGSMNWLYSQPNDIKEDRELDYFAYQFNGKAGMFILDPKNVGVCQSLGDTKMKITFQQSDMTSQQIRTRIASFSIQDVDGLIYKFSVLGLTKILQNNYCDANLIKSQTQPNFKSGKVYHQAGFENPQFVNPWVVGNWYLNEIDDPLTNRKILFYYSNRNINNVAGYSITYNLNGNANFFNKGYCIITHRVSKTQSPELDSIVYPDGHKATFKYGAARIDLAGENVLDSLNITYQGRYLSQYQFKTSYFILNRYGTPVSNFQKSVARLCLRSVRKIGVDIKEDSPPYTFDYYMGSNNSDDFVPPPFYYGKDIWGFFNGSNSVAYDNNSITPNTPLNSLTFNQLEGLCFFHTGVSGAYLNPKSGYAKNGLLRQIIYPTGGTLTYQYDQNMGMLNASNSMIGGVNVSQTISTDGGYSNGCSNPITTQYNYVDSTGTNSSMWGIEMPVNSTTATNQYAPENKHYHWTLSAPFGECYYKFFYPGIMLQQQAISISGFQKIMNTLAPVLGIMSTIGTIMDIITVATGGNPVSLIIDIIVGLYTTIKSCSTNYSQNSTSTAYYNSNLNDVSPLPTQFKRVEVVENPGTIGKTVQEFTSSDDYPLWEPNNPAFSTKQRFAPWAYGLPKLTRIYNAAGNKIKEVINVYNFNTHFSAKCGNIHYDRTALLKVPLIDTSCKCYVHSNYSQKDPDYFNASIYNNLTSFHKTNTSDITVDIYDLYTGRTELDTTYERIFKTNDPTQYVQTVTGYVYNDDNYEPSLIKTKLSNGTYKQKNIYYTIDFVKVHGNCYDLTSSTTTNPEIISLVQHNIISTPVETNEMVITSDLDTYNYTYDKATLFTTLSNGDIKPLKLLEGRFSQPGWQNSPWPSPDYETFSYRPFNALLDPANPNYSFYKIPQTFTYDPSGNLTGIKDEGNRSVTNIYDYNDKYVVASIINADPTTDKSAYSSFETSGLGGWSISGSQSFAAGTAITGANGLNIVGGGLFKTRLTANSLNTSKPYILSLWSNSSNIVITGGTATLVKSGPFYNGFTYYEYNIAQGASSVSVASFANIIIDELRLYPQTARMKTITYDPLIGKTSECDENDRITYYEYDNLGRLRFIKDEAKNIVKMYEYNNISPSKQYGCPAIYYNHFVSETFTKSNCGSGYLGNDVTYTIAANTYSSTISQADADAQAENNLLTNGQNYANTTGACTLLYYNTQQSQNFTSESCGDGYLGGTVTYTVPANRYWSTISLADANQQALDEILANGQSNANDPANANCTIDHNPHWESDEGSPTQCQVVNGEGHLFLWSIDVNPNSSNYNQHSWQDFGPDSSCPAAEIVDIYGASDNGNWYVVMTNHATNDQYAFYISGFTDPEIMTSVPSGVYDISITSESEADFTFYVGCSYFSEGFEAYFYSITVDNSCTPFIISIQK